MKLGLIGLGNMGRHFGNRFLAAGHELVVYDNNPDALERLRKNGARVAASAQTMADEVEFVLLCLPMPSIVQSVVQGPAGVLQGQAVKVIVDLSTTGPSVTDSVA